MIPLLFNSQSLDYYRYYMDEVVSQAAINEMQWGLKSFSLVSTVTYLLGVAWSPLWKAAAMIVLTVLLCVPLITYAPDWSTQPAFGHRLVFLAAIITVIPLVFPMSEAHHLLLQTIPYLVILAYWRDLYYMGMSVLEDKLSLAFLTIVIGHHVGHGLKQTPIRFFCLAGLYVCFVVLLRRTRRAKTADLTTTRVL
ncbi:MAG: hypothetical protein AB1772_11295 [Candidatus Zixiibacteriota bacterium]